MKYTIENALISVAVLFISVGLSLLFYPSQAGIIPGSLIGCAISYFILSFLEGRVR